jgi:peptide/nickel transport system substrate-binding protein
LFNFDEIEIDFRQETDAGRWISSYDFPAVRDGRTVKESLRYGLPNGMEGFAFNTRRSIFADIRVREALGMMFDFEWINANFYGGLYRRSRSFFDDSELASGGRRADAGERALLAVFPGAVRDDILEGRWEPPNTDGSGRDRTMAQRALALLGEAGYAIKDGVLAERTSRRSFAFEILVQSHTQQRLSRFYADSLRRIGINATVRLADEMQYERRRQNSTSTCRSPPGSPAHRRAMTSASSGVRRPPIRRRLTLTTSPARAHPRSTQGADARALNLMTID